MSKLKEKLNSLFYVIALIVLVFIMLATYYFHDGSLIWIVFYVLSILFEVVLTYSFVIRFKDHKNYSIYISGFLTGILFFGHLGVFFEIPLLVYIFVVLLLSSIVFIK